MRTYIQSLLKLDAYKFRLFDAKSENRASSSLASSSFQSRLTPLVCTSLATNGYAVVDGLFTSELVDRLREEVTGLYSSALMHPNNTHLVKGNDTKLLQKQYIHEAELTLDGSIQAKAPLCAELNMDRTLAIMLSLHIPQLSLDSQAIKLQVNSGRGGCFPMHFDSDEMLDGRKITSIFYLNPSWSPGQGGELRLYPFPQGSPVDISPIGNRLVLFSSTRMLHRVMPSTAHSRACFTIWLSQNRRAPPLPHRRSRVHQPPSLSALATKVNANDPEQVTDFLLQPHIRKHVCKLVYADEWAKSIQESHPPGPELDEAVEEHWKEVGIIKRGLASFLPGVDLLKSLTSGDSNFKLSWF